MKDYFFQNEVIQFKNDHAYMQLLYSNVDLLFSHLDIFGPNKSNKNNESNLLGVDIINK